MIEASLRDIMELQLLDIREKVEQLKLRKEEIKEVAKNQERAKKALEKYGVLAVIEADDKTVELSKIEEEIKMGKSIIRRYETVFSMFDTGVNIPSLENEAQEIV